MMNSMELLNMNMNPLQTGTLVNIHPQNAHLYKTGERAAWDLPSTDGQWEPGSYLCFKSSPTKFMPKFFHVVLGQVDAQVVERGQELT